MAAVVEEIIDMRSAEHDSSLAVQQFAHLASQHHNSQYSYAKYGANNPNRYLPLSIHLPGQYEELKLQQRQCAHIKAWWHHSVSPMTRSSSPFVLGPSIINSTQGLPSELVKELSAAMDDTLPLSSTQFFGNGNAHPIKTSSSHPINISSIIPNECIPLISSHVFLTSAREDFTVAPVFEISPSFALDKLVFAPPDYLLPKNRIDGSAAVSEISNNHFRTRSFVSEALEAAINSGLSPIKPKPFLEIPISPPPSNPDSPTNSQTFTGQQILPICHLSAPSLPVSPSGPTVSTDSSKAYLSTSAEDLTSIGDCDFPQPDSLLIELSNDSETQRTMLPTPPEEQSLVPHSPQFLIGNLYLSSCPGKKVRLQGPVKGRSAVCRDLATDIRRMKELGVGCIVCCLDDSELEFLGAPWDEYECVTKEVGIDVLRLPTPEGLAPSMSPAALNEYLTTLINNYTLHGIPVLVHCRGGVGRAGVVACCWMLKLGLCGWFHPPPLSPPNDESSSAGSARLDTLELVEKVISVVRKRRSVKAIETYEQVQFLVDFVEFLHDSGSR